MAFADPVFILADKRERKERLNSETDGVGLAVELQREKSVLAPFGLDLRLTTFARAKNGQTDIFASKYVCEKMISSSMMMMMAHIMPYGMGRKEEGR